MKVRSNVFSIFCVKEGNFENIFLWKKKIIVKDKMYIQNDT